VSLPRNHHYISRFLTDPWADAERFLRYYDFDTKRFHRRSSKSLFAAEQINSQDVERWLGRMLETPFSRIRDRIVRGAQDLEQDEYRAALLLVLLQAGRCATLTDLDARQQLDKFVAMQEAELDSFLELAMRIYDLRVMPTAHNADRPGYAPLSVPSTGLFFVVVPELGRFGSPIAFGIPIAPTCALLVTPATWPDQLDLTQTRQILPVLSVGTFHARRVVVLPGMYEQQGEVALRELLHQARHDNEVLADMLRSMSGTAGSVAHLDLARRGRRGRGR
jgi:hypothetical protein